MDIEQARRIRNIVNQIEIAEDANVKLLALSKLNNTSYLSQLTIFNIETKAVIEAIELDNAYVMVILKLNETHLHKLKEELNQLESPVKKESNHVSN